MAQNRTYSYPYRLKRLAVVDFRFQLEFILDSSALLRRGLAHMASRSLAAVFVYSSIGGYLRVYRYRFINLMDLPD